MHTLLLDDFPSTDETVKQAVESGRAWKPAHLLSINPNRVYIVRRIFIDETRSAPVAAKRQSNFSWLEVHGQLPTNNVIGLEVWAG